jgi:poly(3-hydroxyoctanoate) depolymerase
MNRLAIALLFLAACGAEASTRAPDAPDAPPPGSTSNEKNPDAPSAPGSPGASTPVPSRCTVETDRIACEHEVKTIAGRSVAFAVPAGTAPQGGWPAVVYFQGSFVAGSTAFEAERGATFNMYALTTTMKDLLDRGFAVVAPDAREGLFWQSNVPPYSIAWSGCADDVFMNALFAEIAAGSFGAIDEGHLHAMGISSGGFMTSRMAVSYAGKFRSLAIHSGSYATCGKLCDVPTPLPKDHPPTLFVHGGEDSVVSPSVMEPYLAALVAEGHETKLVKDPLGGHEWLDVAVGAIPAWFDAHR